MPEAGGKAPHSHPRHSKASHRKQTACEKPPEPGFENSGPMEEEPGQDHPAKQRFQSARQQERGCSQMRANAEHRGRKRQETKGGEVPARRRQPDKKGKKQIELFLQRHRPRHRKQRRSPPPRECHGEILNEQRVGPEGNRPSGQARVLSLRHRKPDQKKGRQQGEIEGKNPQRPPEVKDGEVIFRLPVAKEDASDEKPGEDEKQIHPCPRHPAQRASPQHGHGRSGNPAQK